MFYFHREPLLLLSILGAFNQRNGSIEKKEIGGEIEALTKMKNHGCIILRHPPLSISPI
jgi:hypothetical protein